MLGNATKYAIDIKIDEMIKKDIYKWYRYFHDVPTGCREYLAKYYVEQVAEKTFKSEMETTDLLQAFLKIRCGEGLVVQECLFRDQSEFLIDDDDRTKKYGKNYKSYQCEVISKETYIQRNLFRNGKHYVDELGMPLGYEVELIRKKREVPVDLINYRERQGKLTFNLIELKAFRKDGVIVTPARDMLLRAMFEIATYGAYFKAVMEHNDELAFALSKKLGDKFNIRQIKEAEVELTVLAPDYIIDERESEAVKPFTGKGINLLTIAPSANFSNACKVSSSEKLFTIK